MNLRLLQYGGTRVKTYPLLSGDTFIRISTAHVGNNVAESL